MSRFTGVVALCATVLWRLGPISFLWHVYVTLAMDRTVTSVAEAVAVTLPAECSADLSSGAFRMPNVPCYSMFSAPSSGAPGGIVSNQLQLIPSTLLQVSVLARAVSTSSEALCGLDRGVLSDSAQLTTLTARDQTTSNASLEVRGGVDRRWLMTSAFVDPNWYTVMVWTNASLRVLFNPSCSGNNDQHFVHQYVPAWSICRQFSSALTIEFERWNSSTIFAQDQRVAPWVMLPSDYECTEGKDYELVISAANASTNLSITQYVRPGNDSCRMLCIAEQCDGNFFSDHLVGGNQSLTIQYKVRSTASKCDSRAYTGFALVLQVSPENVITLTTYERDSPFKAGEVSSVSDATLIIACVVTTVALAIIVIVSIVIARWRAFRSRQKRVSLPQGISAGTSERANSTRYISNDKLQEPLPRESPRNNASSAQLSHLASEMALDNIEETTIYAEIDDFVLSTDVLKETTCSSSISGVVEGVRFVENLSPAMGRSATDPASERVKNKYTTLVGRVDENIYSVPI